MGKHSAKSKKHKHEKKHRKKDKSRRKSSSSSEEWVEKTSEEKTEKLQDSDVQSEASTSRRDEWMSLSTHFSSKSHIEKRKEREENKRIERIQEQYNPRAHVRELNPYWKDGGDGLPKFQKPSDDEKNMHKPKNSNLFKASSSWRKKTNSVDEENERQSSTNVDNIEKVETLSENDLNALAAKLVKAEIMGKTNLVKELKEKLEKIRNQLKLNSGTEKNEEVLLTHTDSKGFSKPVRLQSNYEYNDNKRKKQKVETHKEGQRVMYFPDDDKYSLQQMFENEKTTSAYDQNQEFLKMTGKIRKNDDMDDIFTDKIRRKESDSKRDQKNVDRAINEHKKIANSMDNCKLCLQSETIQKHLMISVGSTVFLHLPSHEPLTEGHCLIVPIRHVTCATLLDENEWEDVMDFRKALTRMFLARDEDVIFFECAKNLERYPHMYIECIPVPKEEGSLAPIYFKKAIDECEMEWSQNKKLVSLKGKNVRTAIPKGLSYFFVSFGLEEGFAHVIEDQKMFPNNFAQEIIGGILDLHHSKWKRPKQQSFDEQSKRVLHFTKEWNNFDCTRT